MASYFWRHIIAYKFKTKLSNNKLVNDVIKMSVLVTEGVLLCLFFFFFSLFSLPSVPEEF